MNASHKSPARHRIFVVEDEPLVTELLNRVLSQEGYEISIFHDPQQALDKANPQPDLLITDYAMPGMTGSELIRRSRETWPGVRTLMLSGKNVHDLEIQTAAIKPDIFLPKPYWPDQVTDAVKKLLQPAKS